MKRFKLFQLFFLLPGLGLTVVTLYMPLNYMRKQILWSESEAEILEQVYDERSDVIWYRMKFPDSQGTMHDIKVNDDESFTEGSNSHYVRVYYDPLHPEKFEFVHPGIYMLLLFFPVGLVLMCMGWPMRTNDQV